MHNYVKVWGKGPIHRQSKGCGDQGRRQKIFQGGQRKKRLKISKKGRKIALLSLLSTIFVPCLKIQGGRGLPASDAHSGDGSQSSAIFTTGMFYKNNAFTAYFG